MTGTKSTQTDSSSTGAQSAVRSAAANDRLGRFYVAWRSQAFGMLIRAFGSQLDEHAREDAYASAWAASLSSLGSRAEGMVDGELRTYVFSAVTTHAGKELRRRGRKPVDPLGAVEPAGRSDEGPAESLVRHEEQRILRDVLGSLPERRRRVITLRYAVGLTPDEICEIVDGLSLRAYRKEITRGIKDLATNLSLIEKGEWCSSLEAEIQAFAQGQASGAEGVRARAHLAHCASCSRTVRELAGSLNDLSLLPVAGLLVAPAATDAGLLDGAMGMVERVKGTLGSTVSKAGDAEGAISSALASGGGRGGGSALIAGLGAKAGAVGLAGKVTLGCLGAGAGLATCVAAGVVPAVAISDLLPNKAAAERIEPSAKPDERWPAAGVSESPASPPGPVPATPEGSGETVAQVPEPEASPAPTDPVSGTAELDPVIAERSVTPIDAESAPEVAAATSEANAGDQESPQAADADQASTQLGTP